jgi:hypothetical protein
MALIDSSSYTPIQIISTANIIELTELFVAARPETGWLWIACGLFTVMFLPNTANLLHYDPTPNQTYQLKSKLRYQLLIGILSGLCLWLAIKWIAVRPATEFLYFNF